MADVRDIRPDEDTTIGMLMTAVKRIADGQNRLMSDMAKVKATVEAFPQLVADAAAENRRYYKGLQARLDDELGNDYDDVSGSHDIKSLRDAGRNWRKRARDEELAKQESEAKERKARITAAVATGIAIIAGVMQGLQLAGLIK